MSWFKEAQNKNVVAETTLMIHDADRYRTDRYELYISWIKTLSSHDIGFQINSSQLGVASNVEYWHYPLEERNAASKTYYKVAERVRKVVDKIEGQNMPFSNYGPELRAALRDIDPDHKDLSGIYHVNKNVKTETEADWRRSIYGPRYPSTPAIGNIKDGYFATQPAYAHEVEKKNLSSEGTGRKKQWKLHNVED